MLNENSLPSREKGGILERVKDVALSAWGSFVNLPRWAFSMTSFFVFRVFEYASPLLALRSESYFLRLSNIWNSTIDTKKREEQEVAIYKLCLQNLRFKKKIETFDPLSIANRELVFENARLHDQNSDLNRKLEVSVEQSLRTQDHSQVVLKERGILFQENCRLEEAFEKLSEKLEQKEKSFKQASGEKEEILEQNKKLDELNSQLIEQVASLQKELSPSQTLLAKIDEVVQVAVNRQEDGHQTELDDYLNDLIPNYQKQIEEVLCNLRQSRQGMQVFDPARLSIERVEDLIENRILPFIKSVPSALAMHRDWNQKVVDLQRV